MDLAKCRQRVTLQAQNKFMEILGCCQTYQWPIAGIRDRFIYEECGLGLDAAAGVNSDVPSSLVSV